MRLLFAFSLLLALPTQAQINPADYQDAADRIIEAALADSAAFERLAYLADTFVPRFSGTQELEDAIDWAMGEMEADGFDSVEGQEVMVPVWQRNGEEATLLHPRGERNLAMMGLGGSVGTLRGGLTAEVLVVSSFDELTSLGDRARGKIVVYNVPFTTYGETVRYRVFGANQAAAAGAVASLIRSVGPISLQSPHTGSMRYDDRYPRIPHAALSIEAAELLQRMQDRGETPVVRLYMGARFGEDALSRNIIAEFRGRERPEEVVVVGGHIDSWDVGTGAMDDAGGSVVTWEAVRLLMDLGLRPRRTIRVVLWTNEENGLRGALKYRESLDTTALRNHQLALESDSGVFDPIGFGFNATDEAFAMLKPIDALLEPVVTPRPDRYDGQFGLLKGGGGADIGPLIRDGVPGMSLNTANEEYFWYHHSDADTVDKLDAGEVQRCVAAVAILAYVAAEMPERLPHRGMLGEN
ncbi:MAG: M20/M25/M40 family metallo-hydrolase [Bacteroidota bacterium]